MPSEEFIASLAAMGIGPSNIGMKGIFSFHTDTLSENQTSRKRVYICTALLNARCIVER